MGYFSLDCINRSIAELQNSAFVSQETTAPLVLFSFLRAKNDPEVSDLKAGIIKYYSLLIHIKDNYFFEPFCLTSNNKARSWKKSNSDASKILGSNVFSKMQGNYPKKKPLLHFKELGDCQSLSVHIDYQSNLKSTVQENVDSLSVFLLRDFNFSSDRVDSQTLINALIKTYDTDFGFKPSEFRTSDFICNSNVPIELIDVPVINKVIDDEENNVTSRPETINTNASFLSQNIIVYGIPGSGKSYLVEQKYCANRITERTVFHQDYSFADFVGQIMPTMKDGVVVYDFVPGPFARILKKALAEPQTDHILVIEELNRGDAAAIFGSIFQLLDRSKRGDSVYGINDANLALYLYTDPTKEIKIPINLSIIGTMNTSDQNIYPLDTAFQRRWSMKMVRNDPKQCAFAHSLIGLTDVTWESFVLKVNRVICNNHSDAADKRLGFFFVQENDLKDAMVFSEKVLKYLWDDVFRLDREIYFDLSKLKEASFEEVLDYVYLNPNNFLDILKI